MPSQKSQRAPFVIQDQEIAPGSSGKIRLPVGIFTNNTQVDLTLVVIHGRLDGPTVLITACIHGDEINGTEIVRRLLKARSVNRLKGTLIAVPIVNIPGYLNRSRYLLDRRDLNRLFPGSEKGSFGARLAKVVSSELLPRCDLVIDLHTGAINRPNLPQIRVTDSDELSLEYAKIFNAPVTIQAPLRDNSFRSLCRDLNKPVLVFESGEALRLDAPSIRYGVQGITSVMRHLAMLKKRPVKERRTKTDTIICQKTYWERAPVGGIFTPLVALGRTVAADEVLGFMADPYGGPETQVTAARQGILIGRTNEGIADEGDALFHIAVFGDLDQARDQIALGNQALFDDPSGLDDHPVPYDPFMDEIDNSPETEQS